MYVNHCWKVPPDSAAAGIEPATLDRNSNTLTTAPLSHTNDGNNRYFFTGVSKQANK